MQTNFDLNLLGYVAIYYRTQLVRLEEARLIYTTRQARQSHAVTIPMATNNATNIKTKRSASGASGECYVRSVYTYLNVYNKITVRMLNAIHVVLYKGPFFILFITVMLQHDIEKRRARQYNVNGQIEA